jgi:hypothetical protein
VAGARGLLAMLVGKGVEVRLLFVQRLGVNRRLLCQVMMLLVLQAT